MEFEIKQKGYLLIVAAILIVVIGVVGTLMVYLSTGNIRSTINVIQSNDAFNISQSALEIAKRDIIVKKISCDGYSSSGTILNGEYLVTGTKNMVSNKLRHSISSTDITIPLYSVAGFSSPAGVVLIGDEMIKYSNIDISNPSQPNLIGAARGMFNTTAVAHDINISVVQNICILQATAGVPDLTNPGGKRILQEFIKGQNLYDPGSTDFVMYSYGNVILNGNNVHVNNNEAYRSGSAPDYIYDGHTIASHGNVTINGLNTSTMINIPPTTGLSDSSIRNNIQGDVIVDYGGSDFTKEDYFNLFFNENLYPDYSSLTSDATQIQSSDIQVTNSTSPYDVTFSGNNLDINGNGTASNPIIVTLAATGDMLQKWNGNISVNGNNIKVVLGGISEAKVVVVTGSVTLNGNNVSMVVGSTVAPTALVVGGNYSENGNNVQTGLNGFMYSLGNMIFSGNNPTLTKGGIIASEGSITMNGNNIQADLSSSNINAFNEFGDIFNNYYTSLCLQEVFQ